MVFVPQKVKHIHHHHVKKVYVKHKPVEYIEELDEDLHRAGEGGEDDGGLGPYQQQDGDDKVLAAASEAKAAVIVVPDYDTAHAWGKKVTPAPGARSFHTHVSTQGGKLNEVLSLVQSAPASNATFFGHAASR